MFSLLNTVSEATGGTLPFTVQLLCYLQDTMLHQMLPDPSHPSSQVDRGHPQG